ncbi:hypothetical protein E5F05_02295 (plasmid) [Deinococcus metallilatus]|uniref:PepSY domain-containing protein n=1 Tax=Deinococcus metallilatus TaxID=1211322 RepID=A0ABR6MV06_9DEIO|nr:hypothetical protein [Deinococcus metallilatus]MBB5295768.1 hypothetical protein [Deinococcus metallilatus]QBY06794.1 hypothetical protein E5F05_02295 [Deinococcus metallilatus]
MRTALLILALLSPTALAAPPAKPPPPPRAELLGFEEAQTYLGRARLVAGALVPGLPVLQDTPAGPRLSVPLLFSGRPVARAFVTADGALVPRGEERTLPDAPGAVLSPQAQRRLLAQVAALTVSSFARVMGPQVHCYLLSDAQVVAELRFDRKSGQLLEDRGPPGERRPPPRPKP